MMIYLPTLFFLVCLIKSIRKNGWNVGAFLYLLYLLTAIASIELDVRNLYQYNVVKMDVGFLPPILYCLLLWLCISPFERVGEKYIQKVSIKNSKILDYSVYFYFAIFLIIVAVASTRINEILFNSSLAAVRKDVYNEEAYSFYNHLNGIPRYICALSTFFIAGSYLMILVFIFNVAYGRKSVIFNLMTLAGSTCQLLTSIMQADRSQFVYCVLVFVFAITIFWGVFQKKDKLRILTYLSPLGVAIIVYFVAVSLSRWGDEGSTGVEGGTIIYAGQNFFNFCNFLHLCWNTPISFCEIFPLTYYLTGQENYFEWCMVVEKSTHVFMSNFSTFLGLICSISGPFFMILYVVIFRIIANRITKRLMSQEVVNQITFSEVLKVWIVGLVPLLGIFGSFYSMYGASVALISWIFIAHKLK